jgi:hypothetical protein
MAIFGWSLVVLGFMVGVTILRGALLQLLWTWFVVPVFHVSPLSLVNALGIALIATFLTYQYDARKSEKKTPFKESFVETVVAAVILYSFFYAQALVIHAFQ